MSKPRGVLCLFRFSRNLRGDRSAFPLRVLIESHVLLFWDYAS